MRFGFSAVMKAMAIAGAVCATPASAQQIVQGYGEGIPMSFAVDQILPRGHVATYGNGVDVAKIVSWKGGRDWKVLLEELASANGLRVSIDGDNVKFTVDPVYAQSQSSGLEIATFHSRGASLAAPATQTERNLADPAEVTTSEASIQQFSPDTGSALFVFGAAASGASHSSPQHAPAVGAAPSGFEVAPPGPAVKPRTGQSVEPIHISADVAPHDKALVIDTRPPNTSDAGQTWHVYAGADLETVLTDWAERAGWVLKWNSSHQYPIEASAQFSGDFIQVAAALLKTMSRAEPYVRSEFFRGNKVLVIDNIIQGKG